MVRRRFRPYIETAQGGYLVAFDMNRTVIDSRSVDASVSSAAALEGFIGEYVAQGWVLEEPPTYGSSFMNRGGIRILVMATQQNPFEPAASFSPYGSTMPSRRTREGQP